LNPSEIIRGMAPVRLIRAADNMNNAQYAPSRTPRTTRPGFRKAFQPAALKRAAMDASIAAEATPSVVGW